jgi:hypothetical protein
MPLLKGCSAGKAQRLAAHQISSTGPSQRHLGDQLTGSLAHLVPHRLNELCEVPNLL